MRVFNILHTRASVYYYSLLYTVCAVCVDYIKTVAVVVVVTTEIATLLTKPSPPPLTMFT